MLAPGVNHPNSFPSNLSTMATIKFPPSSSNGAMPHSKQLNDDIDAFLMKTSTAPVAGWHRKTPLSSSSQQYQHPFSSLASKLTKIQQPPVASSNNHPLLSSSATDPKHPFAASGAVDVNLSNISPQLQSLPRHRNRVRRLCCHGKRKRVTERPSLCSR
jgi:hypothetical protein